MHRVNTLLILVPLAAVAIGPCLAQRQKSAREIPSAKRRTVPKPRTSPQIGKEKSVVGIYLNVITPDSNGNIWMGGSVWLQQALLVRNDGQQATAVTFPKFAVIDDLVFTGSRTGWMIGDYKYLYGTKDGGATWQRSLKAETNLTSICFTDVKQGWVAGWDGIIYHTTDAGASWHKQASGTELDLRNILFVDALHGWAIGGKTLQPYLEWVPVLVSTNDGGQTWKTIKPCPSLGGIAFADEHRGWGISLDAIFHTTDGGETWTVQYKGDPLSLSSMYSLNGREGWVVGDGVLHTDDGGETWSDLSDLDLPTRFRHVVFTDSTNGWAIGSGLGPESFRTADGGRTWVAVQDSWKDEVVKKVHRAMLERERSRR